MANGDCPVGATNQEAIKALQMSVKGLHEVDRDMWATINRIQNRPPVWATFVMSGLTGAIGVLVTLLVS